METNDARKLRDKIRAYNLFDELQELMIVKRVGGVKRSTIYKAFQFGPSTPVLSLILETAKELISKHEEQFEAAGAAIA